MPIFKRKIFWICITTFLVFIILFCYIYQTTVTKERIIKQFKENIESFERIKQFAQDTEGDLYIDNNTDTLIISNDKIKNSLNDSPYKIVKLDDLSIKSDIIKVINGLKYVGIYEEGGPALDGVIIFSRTVGSEEQGIAYCEDDTFAYGMRNEKIADCWYYFWIGNV
jgi:hypothetical protein